MKKTAIFACMVLVVSSLLSAYALEQPDTRLFQEAKVHIFDKEWNKALDKLDEILQDFPDSSFYSQALFYKGKCLAELTGREREAMRVFKRYVRRDDANQNLIEESEVAVINLALDLYKRGRQEYVEEIIDRIDRSSRYIRYYAAFQLSYIEDEEIAVMALPVLEEILIREQDEELKNRAKLAMLRIDPHAFEDMEEKAGPQVRMLCFRAYKKGTSTPSFSLNIPWSLADLALSSIPEEDKIEIRKKGYDLDELINQLTRMKGNILVLEGDETVFKIWIK